MSINDSALFTAAKGYVFIDTVGTTAPTPAQIAAFDPETFGAQRAVLSVTGTATGGNFTATVNGQTTSALDHDSTASEIRLALEALSNVAPGDVVVTGGPLPDSPVTIVFTGALKGTTVTFSISSSVTGSGSPAVVSTPTAALTWLNVGHTSREDLPEFGFEGGETETRGSWQNAAVKEVVTEVTVDYVTINLHQFDEDSLELYYSQANHLSAAVGEFWVTDAATATIEKAILIVIVDGDAKIAFYARKSSVRRSEAIGMEVDNFAVLPIRATFLKDGNWELYRWISQDIPVNPT